MPSSFHVCHTRSLAFGCVVGTGIGAIIIAAAMNGTRFFRQTRWAPKCTGSIPETKRRRVPFRQIDLPPEDIPSEFEQLYHETGIATPPLTPITGFQCLQQPGLPQNPGFCLTSIGEKAELILYGTTNIDGLVEAFDDLVTDPRRNSSAIDLSIVMENTADVSAYYANLRKFIKLYRIHLGRLEITMPRVLSDSDQNILELVLFESVAYDALRSFVWHGEIKGQIAPPLRDLPFASLHTLELDCNISLSDCEQILSQCKVVIQAKFSVNSDVMRQVPSALSICPKLLVLSISASVDITSLFESTIMPGLVDLTLALSPGTNRSPDRFLLEWGKLEKLWLSKGIMREQLIVISRRCPNAKITNEDDLNVSMLL